MIAELHAKHPYNTWSVLVQYNIHQEAAQFAKLAAAFEEGGWRVEPFPASPLPDGTSEVYINKKGSGLFEGWDEQQRPFNLRQARHILKTHGLPKPAKVRLTLADLL